MSNTMQKIRNIHRAIIQEINIDILTRTQGYLDFYHLPINRLTQGRQVEFYA